MGCAWPDDRGLCGWGSLIPVQPVISVKAEELARGGRCLAPPADCRGVAACQYAADLVGDGA